MRIYEPGPAGRHGVGMLLRLEGWMLAWLHMFGMVPVVSGDLCVLNASIRLLTALGSDPCH